MAVDIELWLILAAIAGWVFLEWRFTGSWSASLTYAYPGIGQFPGGVLYELGQAARTAAIDALRTPLLLVSAIVLARRRPRRQRRQRRLLPHTHQHLSQRL